MTKGTLMTGMRSAVALFVAAALFAPTAGFAQPVSQFQISTQTLLDAIKEARVRVVEFKKIAEWGREHHVRIYAAGGTAAGFAHYVRQNEERLFEEKHGLPASYFKSRFSWTYFDIYRSTQDADIVIDGTEEQALALERFLASQFPYLQGSKSIWEVRRLRDGRGMAGTPGYKEALLDNPNFLNQHSDSHSTGLLELTSPADFGQAGEPVVRDLYDWGNLTDPKFLTDVRDGRVTYWFSPSHQETNRFKDGINPEILSVVRFLTKAFQYGVEPEITNEIKRIIAEFDPRDPRHQTKYVASQLRKNALKLYWHSQSVERARDTLKRLGLLPKLISLGGDVAIWLGREPLPTRPVGTGDGKTASGLGISIVAHETQSFLAYENITMSRRGHPNVFISRGSFPDENAAFGDGFYTKIGREGARGTRITIRFKVNPDARLGTDFTRAGDFIIFHNRAALEVIDESIDLGLLEFLELLSLDNVTSEDRGVLFKFRLKLKSYVPTAEEEAEVVKLVSWPNFHVPTLMTWFSLPLSRRYPELSLDILRRLPDRDRDDLVFLPDFSLDKEMIRFLKTRLTQRESSFWQGLFSIHIARFSHDPDFVEEMIRPATPEINEAFSSALLDHKFDGPYFERLIAFWLRQGGVSERSDPSPQPPGRVDFRVSPYWDVILKRLLHPTEGSPEWLAQEERVLDHLVKHRVHLEWIARHYLTSGKYVHRKDWAGAYLGEDEKEKAHPKDIYDEFGRGIAFMKSVLMNPLWGEDSRWLQKLMPLAKGERSAAEVLITSVFKQPRWSTDTRWIKELIRMQYPVSYDSRGRRFNTSRDRRINCELVLDHLLPLAHWERYEEELLNEMVTQEACLERIARDYFAKGRYAHRADWITPYLRYSNLDWSPEWSAERVRILATHVLSHPAWTYPEVLRDALITPETGFQMRNEAINEALLPVLKHEHWKGHVARMLSELEARGPRHRILVEEIRRRLGDAAPPSCEDFLASKKAG